MLMVISPSKTLDYESHATNANYSLPDNLGKSAELVGVVRQKSFRDLMELMQVSQKIAKFSVERFDQWRLPFTSENAKQAVLAFKGDVYTGLDAPSLSEDKLEYAQIHLRILSGLYGLLRPLDLMQP